MSFLIQVRSKKRRWPLSRGLMAETLQAAGVSNKRSRNVASLVEAELLRAQVSHISAKSLKSRLARALRKDGLSKEAATLLTQTASFEDIWVGSEADKQPKQPFSRGVLARDLEAAGLELALAQRIAEQVATHLRRTGVSHIERAELSAHILRVLAHELGEEEAGHILSRHRSPIRSVVSGNRAQPFSKGVLIGSLLSAGISAEQARVVAGKVQTSLQLRGVPRVDSPQVRELATAFLEQHAGREASERYHALHLVRHPPKPLLILLGGISGSGKSTLASLLLSRLSITRVVSSDAVREVMRAMVSPALAPALHASSFEAGEKLYGSASKKELLAGFREQARNVSVGLSAVAQRTIQEGGSLIIEGVHLTPSGLMRENFAGAIAVPMLLVVEDEAEHRSFFEERGQESGQRPAASYLSHFAQIRTLQAQLLKEAKQAQVPLLTASQMDTVLEQATELVLQAVLKASESLEEKRSP